MQGFQLSFFTEQDRRLQGEPLAEWLLQEARRLGLGGGTVIAASEGFGRHGKLHAARFFELADQPLEVTFAVTAEECERLLQHLRQAQVRLFYIKTPVEFGSTL